MADVHEEETPSGPVVPIVIPLKDDTNQRSLLQLSKVVRLDKSSVCFDDHDLERLKTKAMDPSTPMQELLLILRKLECYQLEIKDIERSGIGHVVKTLAALHPRDAVSTSASKLLKKWWRMIRNQLFSIQDTYDVDEAENAPEGEALAPEVFIEADKEQERLERLQRKRQRIEDDVLCSSTDDDIEDASEDEMWSPGQERTSRRKRLSAVVTAKEGENRDPEEMPDKQKPHTCLSESLSQKHKSFARLFQGLKGTNAADGGSQASKGMGSTKEEEVVTLVP